MQSKSNEGVMTMDEMQLKFERSKIDFSYKNGMYGLAMQEFMRRRNVRDYPMDLQYTWECSKIKYGAYNMLKCGSALVTTSFITTLFYGLKSSLSGLAETARTGGYESMSCAYDGTKEKWFDDLARNTYIRSERVWDCRTVPIGLMNTEKVIAYVMRVRDSKFYIVNQEEESYHYVVLLGVNGDKACVFDAGFGVKEHLNLSDLIHSAQKIWKVYKL